MTTQSACYGASNINCLVYNFCNCVTFSVNDTDVLSYTVTLRIACVLPYQIDKPPEPILLVEQLQDGTERKRDGEEHGGVAAAGRVRAFQQPECVTNYI